MNALVLWWIQVWSETYSNLHHINWPHFFGVNFRYRGEIMFVIIEVRIPLACASGWIKVVFLLDHWYMRYCALPTVMISLIVR